MKRMSHDHVVKLVPVPDDWKKLSSSILCMEYCTEGSLRKLLNQPENSSGLPENTVRKCLKNVKDGLEYIHSQNVIHRDLKPENIVLQKVNDDVVFKLIDFGYGVECDNSLDKLRTLAGTSDYVAPEVFIASDGYTISVDYWGFGFICFEIITGHRPFLPHLRATEWIAKIRHKTEEVISVYELPYRSNGDSIVFSTHLPSENHISKALASKLTLWLRLALKMDYRKRGCNKQNELVIYSSMEDILSKKAIVIFSSLACELLSYDIDESTALLEVKESIFRDTGHPIEDQIVLSPSGKIVGDAANVIDFWNPNNEIAMLFVITKEGVQLPFKEPNPPQSIVIMAEQGKEPSAYHCRKKVYSDSIYFIQTQTKLCEAFYKTIFVDLLSVFDSLHDLTALGENLKHNVIQTSAKLHIVQCSIQYNERCYARACESKVIIECEDFLGEKKQKILLLKAELEEMENKLKVFSDQILDVTKKLEETHAFDYGAHNIEKLNKCLENACRIYQNLQQMPKEIRQCEGNCSDMVNIMFKFLEIMHSIIDDKSCQDTIETSKFCKASISSLFSIGQRLSSELRNLDADVVRVELGQIKAIWSLKPNSTGIERGASTLNMRTVEPIPRMSVASLGSPSPDDTPLSTASLISTNHSLHHQFEESLAQFQGNFEEIKKRFNKLDTELQAV
uniref:IkappaB kinase n=2 Tax=Lygus hesperus TaxID=30085 RepID=A0A146KUQ6_LYGHE